MLKKDLCGQKIGAKSPTRLWRGRPKSEYRLNAFGRVIKEKRRGSPEQSYEYDSIGRIKKEWSAGELQAEYDYGVYGKTLSVKDAMGNAYSYELDEFGLAKKEVNRLGVYQEFRYDGEDRLKQKTKCDGALIKTVCDAKENSETEEYADGSTRLIRRDIKGNIIRIQSEAGTTEYRYDAEGNCIEQKEENSAQTITYEYDVRGRVIKTKEGGGNNPTKIAYDALKVVVLGSLCGLKNISQIHQWATSEHVKTFLEKAFGIKKVPYLLLASMLIKTGKP